MNVQNYRPEYAALQMKNMLIDLFAYVAGATSMPVEQKLRYPDMFNGWAAGEVFSGGEWIRYEFDDEGLPYVYECSGDHVAQANIAPGTQYAGNQYTLKSHVGGVRLWSSPLSDIDAPAVDVIRHFNGTNYRNTVDKNRFSPAQFGWEEVIE